MATQKVTIEVDVPEGWECDPESAVQRPTDLSGALLIRIHLRRKEPLAIQALRASRLLIDAVDCDYPRLTITDRLIVADALTKQAIAEYEASLK